MPGTREPWKSLITINTNADMNLMKYACSRRKGKKLEQLFLFRIEIGTKKLENIFQRCFIANNPGHLWTSDDYPDTTVAVDVYNDQLTAMFINNSSELLFCHFN